MALTSTTIFDIVGQTQSITFNNPTQLDQISFASDQITYQICSLYNLNKSDMLLYIKYLNTFNNLLLLNFPFVAQANALPWPLSTYSITETNSGTQQIVYNQTSQGTQLINMNYVPIAGAGSVAARASAVTITLQEFFMNVYMLSQFSIQVGLN